VDENLNERLKSEVEDERKSRGYNPLFLLSWLFKKNIYILNDISLYHHTILFAYVF
jgi:hypothetical protein